MTAITSQEMERLLNAAQEVRLRAHAPFSDFQVGAALETTGGNIITGCNVESSSYGLTMCAERVAIFKAVAEGFREFRRIAIVVDTKNLTPPCGACRQILWEWGGDMEVILGNLHGITARHALGELLPFAFDSRLLQEMKKGPGNS